MSDESALVRNIVRHVKATARDRGIGCFAWNVSDSFSLGIPDLMIIMDGQVMFLEAKYFSKIEDNKPLLKHTFSAIQVATLKKISMSGVHAFGVVGSRSIPGRLHLFTPWDIPADGNFDYEYLKNYSIQMNKEGATWPIHRLYQLPVKRTRMEMNKEIAMHPPLR